VLLFWMTPPGPSGPMSRPPFPSAVLWVTTLTCSALDPRATTVDGRCPWVRLP
jgi:hypothetical protein